MFLLMFVVSTGMLFSRNFHPRIQQLFGICFCWLFFVVYHDNHHQTTIWDLCFKQILIAEKPITNYWNCCRVFLWTRLKRLGKLSSVCCGGTWMAKMEVITSIPYAPWDWNIYTYIYLVKFHREITRDHPKRLLFVSEKNGTPKISGKSWGWSIVIWPDDLGYCLKTLGIKWANDEKNPKFGQIYHKTPWFPNNIWNVWNIPIHTQKRNCRWSVWAVCVCVLWVYLIGKMLVPLRWYP